MAALGATGVNGGVSNKGLVLAAMVYAVAMTFIDQTIVAIAIPSLLMAASFLVAVRRLPRGRIEVAEEAEVPVSPAGAGA